MATPVRTSESPLFLRKKIHFFLVLAVIATTLFSWYNVNSWFIILLLLSRLLDGPPLRSVKRAFSDKFFLAWFSIFLLELLGLLYAHNMPDAWKHIESKATLVAIPFVLCAGPFTDRAGRHRLLSAYSLLLFAICLYCLCIAVFHYNREKDPSVFFYHTFTECIGVNAVFFSGYVITALLFLLSHPLHLSFASAPPALSSPSRPFISSTSPLPGLRIFRIALVVFFIGIMILLSSKLLLALLIIMLFSFLAGKRSLRLNPAPFLGLGLLVVMGTGMLVCTDNPVIRRYKEIGQGDIGLYRQDSFPPGTVYNGLSLRLLIWKYSCEILNKHHAWVFGVTGGDSQDLLNAKYNAAGLGKGYIGYNCQDQYIEELLRSGVVGLCVFLAACGVLIILAAGIGTREAWFTVTTVLILYLTESMLEMQHSTFFSCFFPLLLLPEMSAAPRPSRLVKLTPVKSLIPDSSV
jgi:hypothetical protein